MKLLSHHFLPASLLMVGIALFSENSIEAAQEDQDAGLLPLTEERVDSQSEVPSNDLSRSQFARRVVIEACTKDDQVMRMGFVLGVESQNEIASDVKSALGEVMFLTLVQEKPGIDKMVAEHTSDDIGRIFNDQDSMSEFMEEAFKSIRGNLGLRMRAILGQDYVRGYISFGGARLSGPELRTPCENNLDGFLGSRLTAY